MGQEGNLISDRVWRRMREARKFFNRENLRQRRPSRRRQQLGFPPTLGKAFFKITTVGSWGSYEGKQYYYDSSITPASGVSMLVDAGLAAVNVHNMGEDATTIANELAIGDWLVGNLVVDDDGGTKWLCWSPRFAWWSI